MEYPFEPLEFVEFAPQEMLERSRAFYREMNRRRTVRDYAPRPVPAEVVSTLR